MKRATLNSMTFAAITSAALLIPATAALAGHGGRRAACAGGVGQAISAPATTYYGGYGQGYAQPTYGGQGYAQPTFNGYGQQGQYAPMSYGQSGYAPSMGYGGYNMSATTPGLSVSPMTGNANYGNRSGLMGRFGGMMPRFGMFRGR